MKITNTLNISVYLIAIETPNDRPRPDRQGQKKTTHLSVSRFLCVFVSIIRPLRKIRLPMRAV